MKNATEAPALRVLIKIKFLDSGVTTIQLNRPEKRNALSQAMIDDLIAALQEVEAHDATRVVVLTGTPGGPFSAGADIEELSTLDPAQAYARGWLKDLSDTVQGMRKPIIAAVEGFALGGGFELALLCDIIYATSSARFGLPEVKISTIPGMGGTQRLARAMGKHRAMEMILTGETFSATQAVGYGLVSKVIASEDSSSPGVLEAAETLAKRIAALSGPVVRAAKAAVLAAEESRGSEQGLETERGLYYATFALSDFRESTAAFMEKRKPEISHR